jgi:hypothetical protein
MTGFRSKVLIAVLLLLGATSSAHAWWWGWRGWGWSRYYPAYYRPAYYSYYAPAYYNPGYPVCAVNVPTAIVAPPATPQSAPPAKKLVEAAPGGQSNEPPLGDMLKKVPPKIVESRSMGGSYAQTGSKDRCKVGFWNLTGRDVSLKVDGQERMLPKDRAVTLDLDRVFVWQLDQSQAVSERVPDEQAFHEVILRQ